MAAVGNRVIWGHGLNADEAESQRKESFFFLNFLLQNN